MEEVGIYYNNASKEIFARDALSKPLPEGDGWTKVSDEPSLGLLAARDRLAEGGFVDDPKQVYWYGTNLRPVDSGVTDLLREMSIGAFCSLDSPGPGQDDRGHAAA